MSMTAFPEPAAPAAELGIKEYLEILRRRRVIFLNVFITVLVAGVLLPA